MFNSISTADGDLNALLQRLWMVDNVERLGIDQHFKYEIKIALDSVYRSVSIFLQDAIKGALVHAVPYCYSSRFCC